MIGRFRNTIAWSMAREIRDVLKRWRRYASLRSPAWAQALYKTGVDPSDCKISAEDLILAKLGGLRINQQQTFILESYARLERLWDLGLRLETTDSGKIIGAVNGISFHLTSGEEILIVEEVFFAGTYDFYCKEDATVIDIGMNVGIASLYFASNPKIRRVISFEPFKQTYEAALQNFKLNPQLAEKIEPNNFGLASSDQTLEVEFWEGMKGSMSIHGLQEWGEKKGRVHRETISVRASSDVLGPLCRASGDELIVLKVDCEGSEYEILPDLCKSGLLPNFSIVMVERHGEAWFSLIACLSACGFRSFCVDPKNPNIGIIYSARDGV